MDSGREIRALNRLQSRFTNSCNSVCFTFETAVCKVTDPGVSVQSLRHSKAIAAERSGSANRHCSIRRDPDLICC